MPPTIRTLLARPWVFNTAVVLGLLALVYVGAEFAFYQVDQNRMEDLRREKTASAGRWLVEEGVSKRFDGQPFIMASANSPLIYGDQFYDLSLICYDPGETGASLIVLVYRVAIVPSGLGAYPLSEGSRVDLVTTGGGRKLLLTLEYAAGSDALEAVLGRGGLKIFASPYSEEHPLVVRGIGGDVAFVDSTGDENLARRRVLDACSSASLAK